jgi:hypothetical protein
MEKNIQIWDKINDQYNTFNESSSSNLKLALFNAISIIENGLEGLFLEDNSKEYQDKSIRNNIIVELIDDYKKGIIKNGSNIQATEFENIIDSDKMIIKLNEFLNWLSENSSYKKNIKARFFYGGYCFNTWPKLFVLSKNGKFYCEYLVHMKLVKLDLKFNFETFNAKDYKWGGYQPIVEIDEFTALNKKLDSQQNWIKSYLSRIN